MSWQPGDATIRRKAGTPGTVPHNPLHYMEWPELFIEFISSMTGSCRRRPARGSEGALTQGAVQCAAGHHRSERGLPVLRTHGVLDGWVSCAGYIGPNVRVHYVSLLVPEVFARMSPAERSAQNLIATGAFERVADFEHGGQRVLASRLVYRITARLASIYFGRASFHPPCSTRRNAAP